MRLRRVDRRRDRRAVGPTGVADRAAKAFLVQVSCGDDVAYAVYKPEAGERPLSDFERGLYRRERAACLLRESLGWGLVPLTVIRDDSPLGIGSLQWFIECDFQEHYFTLYQDAPETHRELARVALFDYVANNTDRKSGHVLRGDDGRIWGIDHELCFSAAFKLRTVIWDSAFAFRVEEFLPADSIMNLGCLRPTGPPVADWPPFPEESTTYHQSVAGCLPTVTP